MLLQGRSIAINIAVFCFFSLGFIGWFSGLSLLICCKRALIGALVVFIAGSWAVKAINAIIVHAMIENKMNQQERSLFMSNRNLEYKSGRLGSTDK